MRRTSNIKLIFILLLLLMDKGLCDYWNDQHYLDESYLHNTYQYQGQEDWPVSESHGTEESNNKRSNTHSSNNYDGEVYARQEREIRSGSSVPTTFSCRLRPPGYYADMDLSCQAYHLCNRNGGGITFQCPEGTRFQQRTMVCDHAYSVNCSESYKFYDANLRIGHRNVNLLDDVTEAPEVFMQVVVKESQGRNSPQRNRRKKGGKKKGMQLVIKDHNNRNQSSHQSEEGLDESGLQNTELRRTDQDLRIFEEDSDDGGNDFRRNPRKSSKNYFHNFPPATGKRATSYTRISFSKPFGFEIPAWATTSSPTTSSTTLTTTTSTTTTLTTTYTTTTATTILTTSTLTPTQTTPQILLYFTQSTTEYPQLRHSDELDLFENFVEEGATLNQSSTTKSPKKSKNKKPDVLPHDHPLRSVIPDQARIVGVQSESSFINPHVMTLTQFLELSRDMDKIHAIRVPLDDKKHVQMIERLAGRQHDFNPTRIQKSLPEIRPSENESNGETIGSMLEELKEIIATRAEKQIAEIHFRKEKKKNKKGLTLQPRGGAPSARFVLPQDPPKLEFGFKPLTTQISSSTTTVATTRFHLDDNDELSAPRPPGSTVTGGDAFFFTTTTISPNPEIDTPTTESQTTKTSLFDFDMRKFFFIPNRNEQQKTTSNSERRVLANFFQG